MIGEEYLDENLCLHDSVSVDATEVLTGGEELFVTIRCDKCGQKQNHTLDLNQIVDDLQLEWVE